MTPYGDGRVYLRGRRYWIAYYAPVRGGGPEAARAATRGRSSAPRGAQPVRRAGRGEDDRQASRRGVP
jgi:hypothetical protein